MRSVTVPEIVLALTLPIGAGLLLPQSAQAQGVQTVARNQAQRTQTGSTQESGTQEGATSAHYSRLDEHDRLLAQIWRLSDEEMIRAKVLLQGPRKTFSVPNLSPIEALGIHARNDAERRKYAEMFARAFHADVERSLAWNAAFTEAMGRLYPNLPVIDHTGSPRTVAPVGAADALGVPRSLIVEPARPAAGQGRATPATAPATAPRR